MVCHKLLGGSRLRSTRLTVLFQMSAVFCLQNLVEGVGLLETSNRRRHGYAQTLGWETGLRIHKSGTPQLALRTRAIAHRTTRGYQLYEVCEQYSRPSRLTPHSHELRYFYFLTYFLSNLFIFSSAFLSTAWSIRSSFSSFLSSPSLDCGEPM